MGTTTGDTVSQTADNAGRQIGADGAPRYTRRLSDKILIAFHHACDQADFEVAEQLLHILEMMLTRRPVPPGGTRRSHMERLVAGHGRRGHSGAVGQGGLGPGLVCSGHGGLGGVVSPPTRGERKCPGARWPRAIRPAVNARWQCRER